MVMLLEVRPTEGEVGVDVLLQEDAVDESRHPSLGVRAVLRGQRYKTFYIVSDPSAVKS